ncbi:mannose-1-phosphate guanylyltransferase [Pelagerythrobacter marensis]|uniref:Mannose-1-phosphate guanylyltransferase n=1 Tax=Pelagerythrobacter marensis TaxID=543877 RepID=A0A0G3X6I9_9SPHN|nr:sugar phosphate nucleotidyltransferase [Pelagerythrobacter marensis]AKM06214.1 Mannose-1-phosphate guanylyltransferase [Pelagerythrobacter marensis]
MTDRIHPIILCGGSGTRLWPRSRAERPKPFLPLLGASSLFEQTLARCAGEGFAAPLVVAGERHVPLVEAQGSPGMRLAVEPAARNTAPAIAIAANLLPGEAIMLVCPSDHHIADPDAFRRAVASAAALAASGRLVAFGIAPDRPETGYGYIERGAAIESGFEVARFVEKPDAETASAFLAAGGFDWNGGIFAFRADTFRRELAEHRPEMAQGVADAVSRGTWEGTRFHPDAASFGRVESESIDYAVMENTRCAALVPVAMGWSDIGSWSALRDARQAQDGEGQGNVARGPVELVDCRNVMVDSDGPRVSCIGLDDVIVVVDGEEVLVTSAAGAQGVGKLTGARSQ